MGKKNKKNVHAKAEVVPKKETLKKELMNQFIDLFLQLNLRRATWHNDVHPQTILKLALISKTFRSYVCVFFNQYKMFSTVVGAGLLLEFNHKHKKFTLFYIDLASVKELIWLPLILPKNMNWVINLYTDRVDLKALKYLAFILKGKICGSYNIDVYGGYGYVGIIPFMVVLQENIKRIGCENALILPHLKGFQLECLSLEIKENSYLPPLKDIEVKALRLTSESAWIPVFCIDDIFPSIQDITLIFQLNTDPIPALHQHMEAIKNSYPNLKRIEVQLDARLHEDDQADHMTTTIKEIHECLAKLNMITRLKVNIRLRAESIQMMDDKFKKFFDFELSRRQAFEISEGSSVLKAKLINQL